MELAKTHEAQELARAGGLMAGVQTAHDRSERLYHSAEEILSRALAARDLRTALQAIRAAVDVMAEARGYLELQGQITGELSVPAQPSQRLMVVLPRIICPQGAEHSTARVEIDAGLIEPES
jgi:hypothetical protein